MKTYWLIIITLLIVACKPKDNPTVSPTVPLDSIYTSGHFTNHKDYYNSQHQVYDFDMLSDGLHFDSAGYIVGTGCNLCLSDVFVHKDCTSIPSGKYKMDSIAKEMTFLRSRDFEDNHLTGTYLLEIKENLINRIILFTSGEMTIDYNDGDTIMNFMLYTADSSKYCATYIGYANQ